MSIILGALIGLAAYGIGAGVTYEIDPLGDGPETAVVPALGWPIFWLAYGPARVGRALVRALRRSHVPTARALDATEYARRMLARPPID